ncbi:MAG: HEAT repeat domain-containing protein [Planctomycetaceae bacterium]
MNWRLTAFGLVCGLSLAPQSTWGDLIKLKNGGELRGTLRGGSAGAKADPIVIETLSGSVVAVARKDAQFVTRRPLKIEAYETKARQTPRTFDAQWKLAEWCRNQGLSRQRKTHLRIILDLRPDHRVARLVLGYSKYDGKWMTREEWSKSRGLVKYKGRYITPEELALLKGSAAELEREREWFQKVRLWKRWLTARKADRRISGLAALRSITDPNAVAALRKNLKDDPAKSMRSLYVGILSRMKGPKPIVALAHQSLRDADYEIRYAALNAIPKDQYATAMPYFVAALKSESVLIVRRAGAGLMRVADERAIPALIDALVTTHRYRVRVPDRKGTLSFGTNGSFGNGGQAVLPPQIEAMLRSGQLPNGVIVNNPQVNQLQRTKVIKIKRDHPNREVLAALQRVTGQAFGFNKRDWRLWLASSKNGTGVKSP